LNKSLKSDVIYFELIFMFQLFYFKVGSSFFITCLYLLNVSLSFLEKASFIILLFSALLRLSFLDSLRSYLKFNKVPFFVNSFINIYEPELYAARIII